MEALPRVGGWIAVTSGPALFGSLFLDWYEGTARIQSIVAPPEGAGISGWEALTGLDLLLVATAILGPLLLLVQAVSSGLADGPGPATGRTEVTPRVEMTRLLAAAIALTGLVAALLIVDRISEPPGALDQGTIRLAGPFLALVASLGVVGGAMLAVAGDRLFEVVPRAALPLATIAVAAAVIVGSLALPWYEPVSPPGRAGSVTGWEAFRVADTLIAFAGAALLASTGLAAALRWRSAFGALALGGSLSAAIVVFAAPHAGTAGGIVEPRFADSYEVGYYVALVASGAIVLTGIGAATVGRATLVAAKSLLRRGRYGLGGTWGSPRP